MPERKSDPPEKPPKKPIDLEPFKKHALLVKTFFGLFAVKDPDLVRFMFLTLIGTLAFLFSGVVLFFACKPDLAELIVLQMFGDPKSVVTRGATDLIR